MNVQLQTNIFCFCEKKLQWAFVFTSQSGNTKQYFYASCCNFDWGKTSFSNFVQSYQDSHPITLIQLIYQQLCGVNVLKF